MSDVLSSNNSYIHDGEDVVLMFGSGGNSTLYGGIISVSIMKIINMYNTITNRD